MKPSQLCRDLRTNRIGVFHAWQQHCGRTRARVLIAGKWAYPERWQVVAYYRRQLERDAA